MTNQFRDINDGSTYGKLPALTIGIVKDNADPAQQGRLKVYVPSIDTTYAELDELPWATYITPFGGTTANFLVGREQKDIPGASSYGFWAIPKNNSQVLVGFLDGNPQVRIWLGCLYQPEMNRTLPQSIEPIQTEIDDAGNYPQATMTHYEENLAEAGLEPGSLHYRTRGGYERSVSHPSNKTKNKPIDDGYYTKPLEPEKADSQTISLTSAGKHYFVMSDVDEHCRIRLKTTEGSQIILDDTNERIYISTAMGRNWVELDETNGKIYVYSDSKVNIRAKNDINLYSDENINIVANKRVNIQSEERGVKIQAKNCVDVLSSEADIKLTASRDIDLKTINGPATASVSESESCELPIKHLVYTWAEDGGSGTSRVRIESFETADILSVTEEVRVTAKKSLHLKSKDSEVNINSKNNINLKSDSAINNQAAKDINLLGKSINSQSNGAKMNINDSINLTANSSINLKSNSSIKLTSTSDLSLAASDLKVTSASPISGLQTVAFEGIRSMNNASLASTATPAQTAKNADSAIKTEEVVDEVVQDKMVRPDKESWERDEDEEACKTPRNPLWMP